MPVPSYKSRSDGFTLLEILVALAILGLMLGLVTTQMGDFFSANMKSATGKLSSTIRYLHDKASTQSLYIRLTFDFEKNGYWVEATTERFLLLSPEEIEKEKEEIEKEKEEKETPPEEGAVEYTRKYRNPEFGAVDEFLLRPVTFPNGVFLKDIYTSHDKGPVDAGKAFIHFFPNGTIEPAVINLRDEEDEVHFSIQINPIVGSTIILQEYTKLEE